MVEGIKVGQIDATAAPPNKSSTGTARLVPLEVIRRIVESEIRFASLSLNDFKEISHSKRSLESPSFSRKQQVDDLSP